MDRFQAPLIAVLFFGLFAGSSSSSYAQNFHKEEGFWDWLFGTSRITAQVPDEGEIQYTNKKYRDGSTFDSLIISSTPLRAVNSIPAPTAQKKISLFDKNKKFIASLTQLHFENEIKNNRTSSSHIQPQLPVFILSRHVLLKLSEDEVVNSLKQAGYSFKDFKIFEFQENKQSLDVILLIPHSKVQDVLFNTEQTCACSELQPDQKSIIYHLNPNRAFKTEVSISDLWYSEFHVLSGKQGVNTSKSGNIFLGASSCQEFFLPSKYGQNPMAAGSSGSVVFLADDQTNDKKAEDFWKFGGVVKCFRRSEEVKKGLINPGLVEVIPVCRLLAAQVFETDLNRLQFESRTQIPTDQDCIPIDGKGGGGP